MHSPFIKKFGASLMEVCDIVTNLTQTFCDEAPFLTRLLSTSGCYLEEFSVILKHKKYLEPRSLKACAKPVQSVKLMHECCPQHSRMRTVRI